MLTVLTRDSIGEKLLVGATAELMFVGGKVEGAAHGVRRWRFPPSQGAARGN